MAKTFLSTPLILIAAAGLMVAGTVLAQSRSSISDQPVQVGADDGELNATGFALVGRAEVTQGPNRLRAHSVTGVRANGQVTSVSASGEVYYVTPTETIRGDRAVYTVSTATIVVSGDVILTQGRNVLTGSSLTYNVDTGMANMDGGSTGRIRGVFYPEGSN